LPTFGRPTTATRPARVLMELSVSFMGFGIHLLGRSLFDMALLYLALLDSVLT